MRSLVVLATLSFLSGCGPTVEYSAEKTEPAIVYDVAFVPAGHGDDVAIGMGTDSNGNLTTTMTPVSVDIPERFAVVFKCQHGKFAITGSKARDLYQRLDKGMRVTVRYREIIHVVQKDGKEVRSVVDLDFLDATPSQAEAEQ